ncbi:phosphohydrolase, partial [Vibrio parahaemolyticus]
SFYCGVAHGTVDLGIIIQNISAHYDEESGWFGMTVNSKALGILQNFVYSRYSMFEHVYNHKTSNGFELLLNLAIEEVMSDEETRKE